MLALLEGRNAMNLLHFDQNTDLNKVAETSILCKEEEDNLKPSAWATTERGNYESCGHVLLIN